MNPQNVVLNPTPGAGTATATDPAIDPTTGPQELVLQLRAMQARIPEYTQLPIPDARAIRVVAKATNPEFVQATINSVDASLNVQQALGRTPTICVRRQPTRRSGRPWRTKPGRCSTASSQPIWCANTGSVRRP